jgi:hypothetical protein
LSPNYHVKSITSGGASVNQGAITIAAANPTRLFVTLETKGYTVSGRVTGLAGTARGSFNNTPGILLRPTERDFGLPAFRVNLSPEGAFSINGVPPGNYLPGVVPEVVGYMPAAIQVIDRDITGLDLRLPGIVEVRGRIILEPGMPAPRSYLEILKGGSRIAAGPISSDSAGSFTINLPEGDFRLGVTGLSPGFQVKAFTYGSMDLLSEPVQIQASAPQALTLTFGYAGTWHRVSGRVVGVNSIADPIWRGVQLLSGLVGPFSAQPADDGSFVFPNVPPGSYTLRVNVPPNMATSAPVEILVDHDLENLQLQVTPPQR